MFFIGIDIGSTASKVVVISDNKIIDFFTMPTGWSCIDTSNFILETLKEKGYYENSFITGTGYGRVSIPFANKTVTEITCHGLGAYYLYGKNGTVIDIGGQDTKIITIENGIVTDFIMNDKCSAGTGRFLEIMSNTLGIQLNNLIELSKYGSNTKITSMCTVFAESEIIGLIGKGEKRENIAYGIVNSVISKVVSLCRKHGDSDNFFLTGGLCAHEHIRFLLSQKLNSTIECDKILGRYAGAIGAALIAKKNINK